MTDREKLIDILASTVEVLNVEIVADVLIDYGVINLENLEGDKQND